MAELAASLQYVWEESTDGKEFLKWLDPALRSLWDDGERSKAERRSEFIQALDISDADFDSDPLVYALAEFVRYVDNLPDEQDKWPALSDAAAQEDWTQRCYWAWVQGDDTYSFWRRRAGLEWVTGEQRAQLGGGWWKTIIDLLDQKWPQWWYPVTSEEDLASWLPDWLAALTAEPGTPGQPAEDAVADLAWVNEEEAAELLGGGWRQLIRFKLDQSWPQWRDQGGTAALEGWLRDWIPTLQAIRDLTWVTPEQRARLASVGAGWPGQLRDRLDAVWAQWRVATDDAVLAEWLSGWIGELFPQLAVPEGGEGGTGDGQVVPAPADAASEVLEKVAGPALSELTVTNESVQALSPEQLQDLLSDVLAEIASEADTSQAEMAVQEETA